MEHCETVPEGENCEDRNRMEKLRSEEERAPFFVRYQQEIDMIEKDVESDRDTFVKDMGEAIGRGVFTARRFYKGRYVLRYKGELISGEEGHKREKHYEKLKYWWMKGTREAAFMYFFEHKNSEWWYVLFLKFRARSL